MENTLKISLLRNYIDEGKVNRKLLTYDSKPYFHFLKYFEDLTSIEEHHFYIGTSFAYSWMPTMLKTLACNEDVLRILNYVKKGGDVDENDLKVLSVSINNSLVGVSKILHFIAPHRYAIWDSRVYRSIFLREYYMDKKGIYQEFIAYINCARQLIQSPEYDVVHNYILEQSRIKSHDVTKISKLRSLEVVLYATDHENKKSKPQK